jgi:predicted 3-demethylubiquinone-9 3-methyltransferase (glyoxalase superfamily)
MSKITPFLWFESQAEEAMKHYMKIFTNSKVLNVNRANGQVLSVTFDLDGQEFIALNAGQGFKFTEAVSFFVNCESQAEVDDLWAKLSEGGQEGRCGWLKDKFGLSWQIIPSALPKLLGDPNPEKSRAALQAMMTMNKIIIDDLEKAHRGAGAGSASPATTA